MKAIDLLRNALDFSEQFGMPMLEDMRDAALTKPTPKGGNHPLWIIGHLAGSEVAIRGMVTGESNSLEQWQAPFAPGTEPTSRASDYPSYDEALEKFLQVRAETLALLDRMDDADLDRPPKTVPPGMEESFKTNGDVLMLILIHQQFHMGQIADARRAAGRKPLFSPQEPVEAAT